MVSRARKIYDNEDIEWYQNQENLNNLPVATLRELIKLSRGDCNSELARIIYRVYRRKINTFKDFYMETWWNQILSPEDLAYHHEFENKMML